MPTTPEGERSSRGGADPVGVSLPFLQIDAFTSTPFGGNPAAVLLLDEVLPEDAMLAIAAEMNLSETAFVEPEDSEGTRRLRWFTPTVEVTLCGHATLAAGRALLHSGAEPPFHFRTLAGQLVVEAGEGGRLRLDFPSDRPSAASPPEGLIESLGISRVEGCAAGDRVWVIEVLDEEILRRIDPDFRALREVDLGEGRLGIAVTTRAAQGDEAEVASRFFAPHVGVDEDPVTGVAHTALGPYWAARLGRASFPATQRSARGGMLKVEVRGDRVWLEGEAVVVAEGRILRPA